MIDKFIKSALIAFALIPLAVWKFVDIIIWIATHITIRLH